MHRFAVVTGAFVVLMPVGPAWAKSDADFLTAKVAYERGDRKRLAAVAPKLESHPLAPYVAYWQLTLGLDDAAPATVRAFLDRYPNTPLADRMRAQWLKQLARKSDWSGYAQDFAVVPGDDVELACFDVQYRWQRDGDEALAAARPLWFSGKSTSDACDPLFAALAKRGDLTLVDRSMRMRLAAEAGNLRLAKAVGTDFPGKDRIAERDFAAVTRDPAGALARGSFAWNTAGGRELALLALERAARKDAGAARGAWVKHRDRLPVADRQYGNARLAFHAARQHHESANAWFREAGNAELSEDTRAWRVRAALRAQAWADVLTAIDMMPEDQRRVSAWRYWQARALAESGRGEESAALLAVLATEVNFYGMLATEALGQKFAPPASAPLDANPEVLAAFAARPEVIRVGKLAENNMRIEMLREWIYIVRGDSDAELLLAAEHARRVGLYDRAINTAERTQTRHDFAMRYLAPYRAAFDSASRTHDIDAAMLYAIARQESRFIEDIVSSAGAVGLMQLMPATARWVAKKVGRADYRPSAISGAELNTEFGAFYFKYWYERLDRMPALAAAAYNAGPGRARAWRPPASLEGAIWVETIPFNETRDYVKKVLANAIVYEYAFSGAAPSLTSRLGTITPNDAEPVGSASN